MYKYYFSDTRNEKYKNANRKTKVHIKLYNLMSLKKCSIVNSTLINYDKCSHTFTIGAEKPQLQKESLQVSDYLCNKLCMLACWLIDAKMKRGYKTPQNEVYINRFYFYRSFMLEV